MRVLVVDDDENLLELLDELLTGSGYTVTTAPNGRRALSLLESTTFQLVIVDWHMPEMNGLEVCRRVRSNPDLGYIYTIILSGRSEKDDVVAGLSAGADDYICKPFHVEELLLRLSVAKRIISLGTHQLAVFALAKLAESRDPETGQHLDRIRSYCWLLGQHLAPQFPEITDEFLHTLYLTSPLHDIGKIGIPDCILLKADRLTDREFEIMKTHTAIGAETLEAAKKQFPEVTYLTMARDIARSHHENFDGTGYPDGLSGQDIPLCSRITAVTDVYDALTSHRPYKAAVDHEIAKSIILERQQHFDPLLLSAFLELEDQFLAIRATFADSHAAC